ncbi:MAG: DUF4189 domain-containing protein [Hyphomicrobiaceae bacterium]
MHPHRLALTLPLLLTVALLRAADPPAHAEAALAVGQPTDVARQGVSMGWAVDYPDKAAAEAEALARCRSFKDAPQGVRDLCRIVESVRDTCLAVALDPDRGTTGVGWGVHKNREWAEDAAIDKCAEASAPKRRASCEVSLVRCDGR